MVARSWVGKTLIGQCPEGHIDELRGNYDDGQMGHCPKCEKHVPWKILFDNDSNVTLVNQNN